MARVPFIGRLYFREYVIVILGFIFVGIEALIRLIILFLPDAIIAWCHDKSRWLFHQLLGGTGPKTQSRLQADRIRLAIDFGELCAIYGYEYEEHVVMTKDGYLLGLHRIPNGRGQPNPRPGTSTGKPVVYLHHGLLMNSEVWLCATSAERSLPLVLAEAGFDVWLGNNRGNKYSKKHVTRHPTSIQFWDFSIDDFAWHDIPDSINYVLEITKQKSLSYVGFSQGSAQAFAALSIHPQLNQKVDVFVALAPAMSPPGLSAPLVDGLMKASPTLMFLFFGRRSILSSAVMWQQILYPPIFTQIIDSGIKFLFKWHSHNITLDQKIAAYTHLYSFASTKSVVHWFQIMRNSAFQMYDDDNDALSPAAAARGPTIAYRPARFPTKNIATPVVLLYGTSDSLVDIDVMKSQLPGHTEAKPLIGYEHVDILWGEHVDRDVIPEVLRSLRKYCCRVDSDTDGDVTTSLKC